MKYRSGFVSNSSATSFVCEICDEREAFDSGYDDECGYVTCENGHEFCESHMTNNIFSMIDNFDDEADELDFYRQLYREKYNCELEYNEEDLDDSFINNDNVSDLMSDLRYDCPAKYCPICSFENISGPDFLKYFLKKNKLDRREIARTLSTEFKNYKELQAYIKEG